MMNDKYDETRIELEYNEFYTQINRLNRISELPAQVSFEVSPMAKVLLLIMTVGFGIIGGVSFILSGKVTLGIALIVGMVIFYLLLYFLDHRKRDKKYLIDQNGIKIDSSFYEWSHINDLHIKHRNYKPRGDATLICFEFKKVPLEFQLDSMTIPNGEIFQVLYMYRRLWVKRNTTNIN